MGTKIRNLTIRMKGEDVGLLQKQLQKSGFKIPTSEKKVAYFGRGTRRAVLALQERKGLQVTGVADAKTLAAAAGPAVVPMTASTTPAATYIVDGVVTSPDRAGVDGLTVRVVDRDIARDSNLAESATDENGRYAVEFTAAKLAKLKKGLPDLQVWVYAGSTLLAKSDIRYNASTHETVNVALPANLSALPSEHETLTGAVARRYDGNLADLQESDERQDITYLANKTGWDARAIALAALAGQFSQYRTPAAKESEGSISPAVYYALFRAGLPADADTLYQTDLKTVEKVLRTAIAQGVVPTSTQKEFKGALQTFQKLGAERLLVGPPLSGPSTFQEMLASSGLGATQQKKFAELYVRYRGNKPAFWAAAKKAFPGAVDRLKIDGKLGFLTINNAPLVKALHESVGKSGVTDPVQLAYLGFHSAGKWLSLLKNNTKVPLPDEIPGDTPEGKKTNYADFMAAQVRLSYPTAAVAEMVESGFLKVSGSAGVSAFLKMHQGKFEIGVQPVEQYVKQNNLTEKDVSTDTVKEVKRVQRVLQITDSDGAMAGLLGKGIDSAYRVVWYKKEDFVATCKSDVGGEAVAERIYSRSVQVHNVVLNMAFSYIMARKGFPLGAQPLQSGGQSAILQPMPGGSSSGQSDVIAYPTLERLFGPIDFCTCEECRSILSPAAYLVDLLNLLSQAKVGNQTALDILNERRPDIQQLLLTCENTNTALPYIDVVNEALEYFVANNSSISNYIGHDTGDAQYEDLLASPQAFADDASIRDAAYETLRTSPRFPPTLPFHQPLEDLRRYFNKFEVPLAQAIETLRQGDVLERGSQKYGWRDIWMEELGISREEYEILTASGTVPLARMYGLLAGTKDADVIGKALLTTQAGVPVSLSNAKAFCRHVGITYDDIVALLKTRFINPNSDLIPKLQRLGVDLAAIQKLHQTPQGISNADFNKLLPTGTDAIDITEFGGTQAALVSSGYNYAPVIGAWLNQKDSANVDVYTKITKLITLVDTIDTPDNFAFENVEFHHAITNTSLTPAEFVRLMRFIRLWKKLGWTIEQTDAAICALFPVPAFPHSATVLDSVSSLDAGFLDLLPRLGIVHRVMGLLNLRPDRELSRLLTCWSDIGTHGDNALYRQMFLDPALLKQDAAFADNGYGEFLADSTAKLVDHAEAIRSAFNLTGDEYDSICQALGFDANSGLTIPNVSAIFRRGYLARKLKTSVRELQLFISLTGIDPFASLNPVSPAVLRLISLLQALKDRSLKSAAALYLLWNQDLSGKSAPDDRQITSLARSLRSNFADIAGQFAVVDDPDGSIMRGKLALVYGNQATDFFFSLLNNTFVTSVDYARSYQPAVSTTVSYRRSYLDVKAFAEVSYEHHQAALEQAILDAATPGSIAYDDSLKQLSFTGSLTTAIRDALKAAASTAITGSQDKTDFNAAMDRLYDECQLVATANLEQAIVDIAPGLTKYDKVNKQLTFSGTLAPPTRDALKAAASAITDSASADLFRQAVDSLYAENQLATNANLEQAIVDAAPGLISYDDFHKRLSFTGVMLASVQAALKAADSAISGSQAKADFENAIDALYSDNSATVAAFFDSNPELKALYEAYIFFVQLRSTAGLVLSASQLDSTIAACAPGKVAYDGNRGQLIYAGVLSADITNAIKAAAGTAITDGTERAAFLAAADQLRNANKQAIDTFFSSHTGLTSSRADYEQADNAPAKQRAVLLQQLLPTLVAMRKRQQALQQLSTLVNTSPALTQDIVDPSQDILKLSDGKHFPLHAAGHPEQPAVNDFLAVETPGLSVGLAAGGGSAIPFPNIAPVLDYAPGSGNELPANSGNPFTGTWSGYVEVPENALCNLRVEADTGATITVTLDASVISPVQPGNTWTNKSAIELRGGNLYAISIQVQNIKQNLKVRWNLGQGWEAIPASYLYSSTLVDNLHQAFVRFLKAASLASGLSLSANELAYLAVNPDYWINEQTCQLDSTNGQGWLNSLPGADNLHLAVPADQQKARTLNMALFEPFQALLDFARIKAGTSAQDDSLVTVLTDPGTSTQDSDSLLFTLTRWEPASLDSLLVQFGRVDAHGNADRTALDLDALGRVYDSFGLVQNMGVSAGALISAATNAPDSVTVRDFRGALRARYDASSWRDVVKPINDEMRSLKRDALVAYILYRMCQQPQTATIDTPDKLFEHFLMDVQMEPGMLTSRIRHALSSVQLFVERCLMNLEPEVTPAPVDPQKWEWMKRYRVWEANRKVFLFPENWLEPELRDDKSPFFKDIESELLQNDITDDSAATAMLNYLAKLEEIAKLEPCGVYHDEGSTHADDVEHVIARTAGAHRKYYYRRYEGGSWLPWEQVKLDIEDNPVIPVKWNNRLFLFWVRVIKQAPLDPSKIPTSGASHTENGQKTADGPLGGVQLSAVQKSLQENVKANLKVKVQVVLCWSEYYNGKWQVMKTSDPNNPITMDVDFSPDATSSDYFDRAQLRLWAYDVSKIKERWVYHAGQDAGKVPVNDDTLWVFPYYESREGNIPGVSSDQKVFHVYNTHSLPDCVPVDLDTMGLLDSFYPSTTRILDYEGTEGKSNGGTLVNYYCLGWPDVRSPSLLETVRRFTLLQPHHFLSNPSETPFFFSDGQNVFWVSTSVDIQVSFDTTPSYGFEPSIGVNGTVKIPPIVLTPVEKPGPKHWNEKARPPEYENPGIADTSPVEKFVTQDAYVNKAIGTTAAVKYDKKQITPSGAAKQTETAMGQ